MRWWGHGSTILGLALLIPLLGFSQTFRDLING
jgi:hypothetical protein